ncbi:MAG: 50S ribosomal protein L4 [Parcubacteria group bacterium GW2011_GWC1_38_6]|nr:MAG: 50S ribosomal protein L4 [Parcubacteria group bacterium GW2011_GWA1_36_12]KKQ76270.1 MAG: 50S ribosomal protein L4 [Parcubacteria group bacterium GW2011_GWC1_38_6]
MKAIVYNQEGREVGNTVLPKEIFDVAMNSDLVHQVVVAQSANRRKIIANTKDRSQVRGGGKKPWKQKGTGRARHGSIRSPLWKGGGVTFGPTKERVFSKIAPKKLRRKALFMVLSAKAKNNLLFILDELTLPQPKTKMVEKIMNKFPFKKDSCLIALPSLDKNFILASRNLPRIITIQAKDLNCIDLLSSKYLVVSKESVKVIKDTIGK